MWNDATCSFYILYALRRKCLLHNEISKIFFLDHFSLSFLGEEWQNIRVNRWPSVNKYLGSGQVGSTNFGLGCHFFSQEDRCNHICHCLFLLSLFSRSGLQCLYGHPPMLGLMVGQTLALEIQVCSLVWSSQLVCPRRFAQWFCGPDLLNGLGCTSFFL